MKANLTIVLPVIAVAALMAAPAVAKTRAHAPAHPNGQVVVDGKVVGADPDANIRGQIRRDWDWYRD
jgi:hypothetical protein